MHLQVTDKGHTGIVYAVDFSPDNNTLASSSRDRTVKLWNLATGDEMITLRGHRRRVRSVAFSTDSSTLASASDDNVVKLLRAASIEEVRRSDW
jgi:WD40 repeat protein